MNDDDDDKIDSFLPELVECSEEKLLRFRQRACTQEILDFFIFRF